MFCIVETIERKGVVTSAVPCSWVKDSMLYWPNVAGKKLRFYREHQVYPEDGWTKLPINRILFNNIKTFTEALDKEKLSECISNSDGERALETKQKYKRKHPVKFQILNNTINLNDEFDKVIEETKTIASKPLPTTESSKDSTNTCNQSGSFDYDCAVNDISEFLVLENTYNYSIQDDDVEQICGDNSEMISNDLNNNAEQDLHQAIEKNQEIINENEANASNNHEKIASIGIDVNSEQDDIASGYSNLIMMNDCRTIENLFNEQKIFIKNELSSLKNELMAYMEAIYISNSNSQVIRLSPNEQKKEELIARLPLKTIREMQLLDNDLKNDEETGAIIMNHLTILGGNTTTVILKRIFQTIVSPALYASMTLRGTVNKTNFSSFKYLYNLILKTGHKIDPKINSGVYEKFLKNIFKNSKIFRDEDSSDSAV